MYTNLAHESRTRLALQEQFMFFARGRTLVHMLMRTFRRTFIPAFMSLTAVVGCGRRVTLPPVPVQLPHAADSAYAALARQLAPVLYVQRDEPFALRRVVAVLHPTRSVIAYHLLWNHDVNGQWMPWTKADDAEVVWVGYDSTTRAPTELWTYWHGTVLHTSWRDKGRPAMLVQWGKHGTLPYGIAEGDLPWPRTLNFFYAVEFALLPDIWLGKASHGGPWGFFHGYRRYRDFTRIVPLEPRLDAIVRSDDPRPSLLAVFGPRHANKQHWPDFTVTTAK
jgi:hypothetical protein